MSQAASSSGRGPGPEAGRPMEYRNQQSVEFYPRYELVVPGTMCVRALDAGDRTMTIEYELVRTDGLIDRALLNCVPQNTTVLHGIPSERAATRAAEARAQ